jgi:hypothetical protein
MMKLSNLVVAAAVVVAISAVGCKSAKQEAAAPAPQAQAQPEAPAAQAGGAISGKVVETMNSGGYTYVLLENSGKKMWVALPDSKVKVGQQVTCQPGMVMNNFTSKTLNRTFDSIVFSGGLL